MDEQQIAEVEIDAEGRLWVRPTVADPAYVHVYRAGMEVSWDEDRRGFYSPTPREWSHADWFRQIVAAVRGELGVALRIGPDTVWCDVPETVRAEIAAGRGD